MPTYQVTKLISINKTVEVEATSEEQAEEFAGQGKGAVIGVPRRATRYQTRVKPAPRPTTPAPTPTLPES